MKEGIRLACTGRSFSVGGSFGGLSGFCKGYATRGRSVIAPGILFHPTRAEALMRHRRQLGTAAVILFSLAAGCKSSDNGTNPGPQPSSLAKAAGDSQAGDAGTTLSTPLQVLVADTAKAGVKGIPVDWVAAGGGSVTASSSVSDTDGIARVSRVLPANAAMVTTTATHAGLTGSPITFTSFSQIAGAFKIVKVAGDSQNDTVGATLANPYQVEVLNYQNAPVASANVRSEER